MTLTAYIGTVAAFCTTVAFVPQIVKLRKQGGEDLSYQMLFLYLRECCFGWSTAFGCTPWR